ncbi:hypothetical protein [Aquitalea magnusonii]|uniref:hypothetical protein n=1 Tax=Aquitalea magnusonii TaxID=332411 RepID=UPI0011AEBC0B|nr:hypothetical protein [Aquitalea magnusonii]
MMEVANRWKPEGWQFAAGVSTACQEAASFCLLPGCAARCLPMARQGWVVCAPTVRHAAGYFAFLAGFAARFAKKSPNWHRNEQIQSSNGS